MAASISAPATSSQGCCYYINQTAHVQVLRIENIPNWYFERVAIPDQPLIFQAPFGAQLDVYSGCPVSSLLCDRISCDRLRAVIL
ncbi:DUF1830 domain-containing protein [Acaryochloris sp. CCMEE 5410]|nr:DUF1830 domain-containing protein [Acaryochloris sp. CCMEE 5410]